MGKKNRLKKKRSEANKKPVAIMPTASNNRRSLGLAMIMKDEIEDLHRIINDYSTYFDKIYITVTDSDVYAALREYFTKNPSKNDLIELSYFKWINHFGQARIYNQQHVETDYWMWIDMDDEINGAGKLAQVIEYMESNLLDAVWLQYDYIKRMNTSDPGSIQWKVRIIKTASGLGWSDDVIHENVFIRRDTRHVRISESDVFIKHRKTSDQLLVSGERNRSILEDDWQQHHNPMTAHYQGRDFMMLGNFTAAIEKFLFVTEYAENDILKFDAWENICEAYFQMGNYDLALAAAEARLAIEPNHPGPWYQKFAVNNAMGNSTAALEAAEVAMSKHVGENDIGILLNYDPAWYQYKAPFNVAQAYLSANNIERAYQLYKEVKNIAPQYVEELSNATGIQWDTVFEQAYINRDITI